MEERKNVYRKLAMEEVQTKQVSLLGEDLVCVSHTQHPHCLA
jgi:hypothetical protein